MLRIVLLCSFLSACIAALIAAGTTAVIAAETGVKADTTAAASPLGNAFTYQGKLEKVSDAATGSYDFQFLLFDAAAGGNQVGSTISTPGVAVLDGLFTVTLDFGTVFDSNERWLEVRVRSTSASGYDTLGRQELTATPFALYARAASEAQSAQSAQTAQSAASVPWNGITGIPSDIADGDQVGPSYTAGTGLNLSGLQFSVNFAGGGTAVTAARSDHDHFGQTWPGSSPGAGLTVENESGPAIYGYGTSSSHSATGALGVPGNNAGVIGSIGVGVCSSVGSNFEYNAGVYGSSCTSGPGVGVSGFTSNGIGVSGKSGNGPASSPAHTGVYGVAADTGTGVYGQFLGASGVAIQGRVDDPSSFAGLFQGSVTVTNGHFRVTNTTQAIAGVATGTDAGSVGVSGSAGAEPPNFPALTGMYGYSSGTGGVGVYGRSNGTGSVAIKALADGTNSLAGQFVGAVTISGPLSANGCSGCSAPSDARLKHDVTPLSYGLDAVDGLSPVTFQYNDTLMWPGGTKLGFLAQDVQKVLPEAVTQQDDGYLHLDYEAIIPVLVKAMQEQQSEIALLQNSATCRE